MANDMRSSFGSPLSVTSFKARVHELLQEWSDGMSAHSYSLEASATHDVLSSAVAAYTGRALEAGDRAAVERNLDRFRKRRGRGDDDAE
jgi:hypothetical protein